MGLPACFLSRVRRPLRQEKLSAVGRIDEAGNRYNLPATPSATSYSTFASRILDVSGIASVPRSAQLLQPSPSRIDSSAGLVNKWVPLSFHPCLPFCWSRCKQQGLFAPRALPCFSATTDPSATLSSFHRFPGVTGYTASFAPPISQRDEEGFSSCLAHPCHRAVAITPPECLAASVSLRRSMLPSPHVARLGLWGFRFEAISAFTFVTAR
jgi:hypothetical protein